MKERPILFNGEMVRAILAGHKTQTRRPIKVEWLRCLDLEEPEDMQKALVQSPYQVGVRLWVRETWSYVTKAENEYFTRRRPDGVPVEMLYRATDTEWKDEAPWSPSIHMPRWASRITLEITGVRVERIKDISRDDEAQEGTFTILDNWPHQVFKHAWDSIYAKRGYGWETNPWVWVVEFKQVSGPGPAPAAD